MGMSTLAPLASAAALPGGEDFKLLSFAYLQTIGWAVAGGVGMGLGLIICLKIFTVLTRDVDEWAEIKKNNLGMAIIMASVILGTSLVIMMVAKTA